MTQTAVPNATDTGDWQTSGCTTGRTHQCIDEGIGADDGNYAWETTVNDFFTVNFTDTLTDPGTHWGHQLFIRMGRLGAGVGTFGVTCGLYQNEGLIEEADEITLSAGYTTYTIDWSQAAVANITDYDALKVKCDLTTSSISSGTPQARVENMQLECPDVGAMEANISLVSGASGTVLGAGALGASLALLSTATGTSLGAGALAASVPAVATVTAGLGGTGALATSIEAGPSAMPPSTLTGAGALATSIPLASDASGTATGAAAIAASISAESHMAAHGDAAVPRKLQLTLPNEGIATYPLWTLMLPDFAPIAYLRVENKTDVRIEGRFGSSGPREFFVEPADFREWWLQEHQLRGPIYVRGSGVDPSSGDVKAEIHYQ